MRDYQLIPEELRQLDRWVCAWRDSKCPMRAFERRAAGVSDSDSWADFECARQSVANGAYDDIGFVFAGDGYVGIDVDDGFDGDGFLTPEAAAIISRFDSYTEQSRSGRGFHIFVKGVLPCDGYNNRAGKEIYSNGRYFLMTGARLLDRQISENQPAIDWYIKEYFSSLPAREERTATLRQYNPVWSRPGARVPLSPSYPPVGEGGRNLSMLSLGGQLRETGYGKSEITRILMRANKAACDPPLPLDELREIVNSVFRYRR